MSEQSLPSRPRHDGRGGFRAVLTPYRSLSPTGFLILMAGFGLVSFVTGGVFLAMGAWPVFGFYGLDVLLIYIAFRLNYRAGRQYETVEIANDALTVTRVAPSGARQSFDFNPYLVRVDLEEWPDGRTELRLASQGRELSFGRFLTDGEKRDLAEALEGALIAARGGPRI